MDFSDEDIDVVKPLSPRRAMFVAEYLVDLNATQAAIRAGYSPHTANEQGNALLANLSVKAAIERGKAQRLARVNTTADSVIHEMSLLSNSSIEHYYIDNYGQLKATDEAPEGAMRAIKSLKRKVRHDKEGNITYEVEFQFWDKPGSLKLMGKHANVPACFDRVEVTGKDGGPVITQIVRELVDAKSDSHS